MKYIKGFDGLRCYSILLVITTHLGVRHLIPKGSYLEQNLYYFFSGAAGVNVFFAISGFLITSLLLHEYKKNGRINLKYFFIRRFLRLLPPIIPFYIALFIFMQLGYVRETYIGLLASVFYLFNFVPKAKAIWSPELTHTWSLAVEEQFYLIWAFLLRYTQKVKKLYWFIFFVIVVSIFLSYWLPQVQVSYKGKIYDLDKLFFVDRWTLPAIATILIGALAAILNFYDFGNIRAKFKQTKYGVLAFLVFLSPLYLPDVLFPLARLFHGTGSTLILLWVFNNQDSKLVNVLEWSPIRYIGVISYGLYVWQGFFVRSTPFAEPKIWVHDFPYNVVLTFLVAIISYEFYEKRISSYKRKYKV